MLSVTCKPFMLSVVMLNVVLLSVVAPQILLTMVTKQAALKQRSNVLILSIQKVFPAPMFVDKWELNEKLNAYIQLKLTGCGLIDLSTLVAKSKDPLLIQSYETLSPEIYTFEQLSQVVYSLA